LGKSGEWSDKQMGERMGKRTDARDNTIGGWMDRWAGKPMAEEPGEHGDALAAHGWR
jgi:hypothetical protein